MAAQSEESVAIAGEVDGCVSEATAIDSCEGVEMTAVGGLSGGCDDSGWKEREDGATEMKVTLHDNSVQEPSVKFIVKDVTDTDWQKSRYSCCLPHSTAVIDLYSALAKEAGYEEDSFLLAWYFKDSSNLDEATPLSPKSTQTLYELDMPAEPDRCYLYLQDGPDSPPVKVSSKKSNEGVGKPIELASSVSTTPSSHHISNSPSTNTWSTGHYSNKSETGFVGLVNQAMTCYLNSLLQTLYMTPEFRKALYSWKFNGDIGEGIKSIPYQLQRLFIHLQTSTKRAVETTDVTKSFGWDSSEAWQQHDVQELCRVMFDALEKRLRKDECERPELINELYQGDLKDYVKCLECNNESAREDHFLDIPLVIKPFGSSKAYGSVEEALEGFVDPETLKLDNQYFCDKCEKKCDAHKGLKFTRFPYLLTMQLKRFDFDYATMHRIKLNDRMTFPSVLNLNKFIDESDMPERKMTDKELEEVYQDFVIEKFEKRPSYMSHSQHFADSASQSGETEPATAVSQLMEMLKEGPYVYELFSIMIHSGSAIGGHYYAYIKSLTGKQWYSFNDQSVSRISREDIEQTFGGSDRSRGGYYSSVYASSANAYMLMYRKVDTENNKRFETEEQLPPHVLEQIKEEQQQELREKERQEWERNLCKFRVFMRHPTSNEIVERKIEVHKDKSLADATSEAYKNLGLSRLVPLERCRLVKFDEYTETLDQSFDLSQQDSPFGNHVGGARSYYSFELFMEIRPEGTEFKVYNKGGLNLKVLVIDLPEERVREPVQFRAEQGWTVNQLKLAVAEEFDLDASVMTIALETYQNEGKHLSSPDQTLKNEGFYRKHTVFVCCHEEDYQRDFQTSWMNRVIDKYANTITLYVTVPPPPANPRRRPDGSLMPSQPPLINGGFDDNFVSAEKRGPETSRAEDGPVGGDNAGDEVEKATEEESKDGVAEAESSVAVAGSESGEGTGGVAMEDANRPLQRTITIQIDRRKTLGDLKQKLEAIVLVHTTEFKIYRVYSNNQEYEVFRLQDSLQSVPNETRMIVRLGRALLPGEFRIKLSLLRINETEYFKSLMDSIVAKGMTVRQLKERLVKEAYEQGIEFPLQVDRMRLRKKTWRSPGTVYLDPQLFEHDIHVFANYEMFVEPLPGEEPMKHATQMQIYVRRWRPSAFSVDKTQEVILNENTPEHLKVKISELSGLPVERVLFAKAYGSFPCEMSVLDLENDLEWNPHVSTINSSPLAIYDDGAVLYYKDAEENVAELSTERKAEIMKQENTRLSQYSVTTSTNRRKPEPPLKIFTGDDDNNSSSTTTKS